MQAVDTLPASALSCAVQYAADGVLPPCAQVKAWVNAGGMYAGIKSGEVTVRFVGEEESAVFNATYRDKAGATNVLSFDYRERPCGDIILGDVIICPAVVRQEAEVYAVPVQARYAHMVVHGVLHLAGYSHEVAAAAEKMEAAEKAILARFNIRNPYQ